MKPLTNTFPQPIQAYSIPAVLTGNDLVAIAQTGKSSDLMERRPC